jgi:hypothetical protein
LIVKRPGEVKVQMHDNLLTDDAGGIDMAPYRAGLRIAGSDGTHAHAQGRH